MTSVIASFSIVVTSFIFHHVSVITANGLFSNITCREKFVRNLFENYYLYWFHISSEQFWIKCIVTFPPTFALDFHQDLDLTVVLFGYLRVEQHSFSE